ncbi:hypothetical protein SLEP1_g8434 [Rubroshorea leprosula]|uniref:Uncharacterized protein n=1 Tax=Rubroshorea leprosula TaxID=152421 RepID=A0AAV5IBH4_9ROSI|nr:hypothetical protein SLEP1_g8434 [Rubroshorea leprosula]
MDSFSCIARRTRSQTYYLRNARKSKGVGENQGRWGDSGHGASAKSKLGKRKRNGLEEEDDVELLRSLSDSSVISISSDSDDNDGEPEPEYGLPEEEEESDSCSKQQISSCKRESNVDQSRHSEDSSLHEEEDAVDDESDESEEEKEVSVERQKGDEDLVEDLLAPLKEKDSNKCSHSPCRKETLTQKFSFGFDNPVENSGYEEEELNNLWNDMDFNFRLDEGRSTDCGAVSDDKKNESGNGTHDASLCSQGECDLIFDSPRSSAISISSDSNDTDSEPEHGLTEGEESHFCSEQHTSLGKGDKNVHQSRNSKDSCKEEESDEGRDGQSDESKEEKRVRVPRKKREKKKVRVAKEENANFVRVLADSILKKGDGNLLEDLLAPLKEEDPDKGSDSPCTEETLPQRFSFGIDKPVEKSGSEEELDNLWKEMDFNLTLDEIGSTDYGAVSDNEKNESANGENDASLCSKGEHDLILDLELGLRCIVCGFVKLEIKYVCSPIEKDYHGSERENLYFEKDGSLFNQLKLQLGGGNLWDSCDLMEGKVWELIPEIWMNLYPHQREGFRFLWKNLAGSFDLAKLRSSNANQIGGCIISHAPGTGKTRLTMVFLQAFLQIFQNCRPVIVAPKSVLVTWVEEFKKWKINVPFHNLNDLEFSEEERKVVVDYMEKIRHKNFSKNEIRMMKLYLWTNKPSILGVSYCLFEKLVGGKFTNDEGRKKKRKEAKAETKVPKKSNGVVGEEREEMRKILLEMPGLLVLDEGHTPRNHRSGIWKCLSKVKTKRRIILSGTPFQNNFTELYNTLCIVRPSLPDKIPLQLKKFCQKTLMPRNRASNVLERPDDREIEELKALMAPFVHIHKGDILKKSLPGLTECVVLLNAPNMQKELLKCVECQNTFDFEHKITVISVHPALVWKCSLSHKEESAIKRVISKRLKKNRTDFLQKLKQNPNEEQLNLVFKWNEGEQVLCMHGKLDLKQRHSLINIFNDPNSEAKVLLASTKACSEGIHLVGASRVILLDVVWNPSVERQAISRAYRLGQKKEVYTYHLMISGTLESDKYCTQAEKDRVSELVFSSGNRENGVSKKSVVSSDKILDEMASHAKLKGMIESIIYQPKESSLIKSFSL